LQGVICLMRFSELRRGLAAIEDSPRSFSDGSAFTWVRLELGVALGGKWTIAER